MRDHLFSQPTQGGDFCLDFLPHTINFLPKLFLWIVLFFVFCLRLRP